MKKKLKTNLEMMQEIRKTWTINPITRVHDNDDRKNVKKERQKRKKESKEALKDDQGLF